MTGRLADRLVDRDALARRTDPATSHDAAPELRRRATMARRLLTAYAVCPLTAEEASDAVGYGPDDGAWKRVSDLANAGLITNTDQRRPGRSGRDQLVRAITPAGRAALTE